MGKEKMGSTEFARGNFPPHGSSEICGVGEIIVAHSHGPFNVEGVEAINRVRMEFLRMSPITQPRCLLAIWKSSLVMSLEAIEAHRAGLQEAFGGAQPKLRAVAWVADGEVEGFDWMERIFVANFATVGIPLRLFRSLSEAQSWLRACLTLQETP